MINVAHKILTAWSQLLDRNISCKVYRTSVPASETGNYVVLRMESETDRTNNSRYVTAPVIITEVVCVFKTMIDDSVAPGIDSEITELLFSSPAQHNLPPQDGISITDVRRLNATYLDEDDGTFKYHRIITRNIHRVQQTVAV